MGIPLTDPWFEAEFLGNVTEKGYRRQGGSIEGAQGIFLYSPCGYGLSDGTHAVVVFFENPRNAAPVPPNILPKPRWKMSGSGLHDLTLSPSINCQTGRDDPANNLKAGECKPGRLCWHGHIQNGQVT